VGPHNFNSDVYRLRSEISCDFYGVEGILIYKVCKSWGAWGRQFLSLNG